MLQLETLRLYAMVIMVSLTAPVCAEDASGPKDRIIRFESDDPAMNDAIAKARSSLPDFWTMFAAPAAGVDDFSLKLAISDDTNTEHFWCSQIEGNQEKATCVIANEPQDVHVVAMGQTVDVDPEIISDWMFRKDGKIVGGQTIRVMVTTMEPADAAQYKALLADE
jgi:uncharacterized protein YegJ (DUF2314 family)